MSTRVMIFAGARGGLVRQLGDLDRWCEEKKNKGRLHTIEARRKQLKHLQRPFKKLPQVDAFLRKFNGKKAAERKQILVLTGPSGMGKTQFVRSLFTFGSLLELNAGSMKTVCLPGWDEENTKQFYGMSAQHHSSARTEKYSSTLPR